MVGDLLDAEARAVGDQDAVLGRRADVDAVVADRALHHELEPRQALEHALGEGELPEPHDDLGVGTRGEQVVLGAAAAFTTATPAPVSRSRASAEASSNAPMFAISRCPSRIGLASLLVGGRRVPGGRPANRASAEDGRGLRPGSAPQHGTGDKPRHRSACAGIRRVPPSSGGGGDCRARRRPRRRTGKPSDDEQLHLHTSHWGAFEAEVEDGAVVAVRPYAADPDPSPAAWATSPGASATGRASPSRWSAPAGSTGARGRTDAAAPSRSCRSAGRPRSTSCRGSFGASTTPHGGAGRLRGLLRLGQRRPLPPRAEPAPSLPQLPRRASCAGEHTYSNGALTVIMPHVVGDMRGYLDRATAWSVIERHTELFVCFGGIPLKNTMVSPGGASRHPLRDHLLRGEGARRRVRPGEPDARRPARSSSMPSGSRSCRAPTSP